MKIVSKASKKTKQTVANLIPGQSQIDWNKDFDANYASTNCTRDVAYGYLDAQNKIKKWI